MKKLLAVILVLLVIGAVGYVGATFYVGGKSKKLTEDFLANVSSKMGMGMVTFETESFDGGFFTSEGTSRVALKMPMMPPGGMSEAPKLKHKVYHGPVAMTPAGTKLCAYYMESTLDLSDFPEVEEMLKQVFGDDEPITIKTTMGMSGPKRIDIEIPEFTFEIDGGKIEFAGVDGFMTDFFAFNYEESSGEIDLNIRELVVTPPGSGVMKFDGASIKATATQTSGELLLGGESSLTIPNISFRDRDEGFDLKNFKILSTSSADGGALSGKGEISFEEINIAMDDMPVVLRDGGIKMGFEGLNVAALEKLMAIQKELQDTMMSADSPDAMEEAMGSVSEMFDAMFNIVQPGAGMDLEVGLGAFEMGPVNVNGAKIAYALNEKDGNIGASFSYKVDSVALPDDPDMAPFAAMLDDGAELSAEVHGLKTEALVNMFGEMRGLMEASMNGDFSQEPPSEEEMMMEAFNLIQRGTGFGLTAQLGQNNAKVAIDYASDSNIMELKTVAELFSAFEGSVDFRVDRSVLPPDASEAFAPYIEQRFILETPEAYSTSIKLQGGNLNFNGNEISVPDFLGPGADQPLPWAQGSGPF